MDLPSETDDMIHRDLLATGFVLSGIEAHPLRSSIEEQERIILDIDARIGFLKRQLVQLRARRLAFVESSATKRALLAPVRKLAPEILGEVFKWCIPIARSISDPCGRITPNSAPLLLIQVCRQWRRVALGTPHLWTTLALECDPAVNPRILISMWLQHSRSLPIDIYISGQCSSTVLHSISEHMHRVRVFHYQVQAGSVGVVFPTGRHINAPLMHELKIIDSGLKTRKCGTVSTPNLHSLQVNNLEVLLQLISTHHFRNPFAYLQNLSLTWRREEDICSLLGMLHTPSLQSLSLTEGSGHVISQGLAPALQSFLSPSTPSLKELRLVRIKLPDVDLISILDTLPSLESLSFSGLWIGVEFVTALTLNPSEPLSTWVLPQLCSLSLDSIYVGGQRLAHMIESRVSNPLWTPGTKRLTRAEVVDCVFSRDDQAALEKLGQDFDWFSLSTHDNIED